MSFDFDGSDGSSSVWDGGGGGSGGADFGSAFGDGAASVFGGGGGGGESPYGDMFNGPVTGAMMNGEPPQLTPGNTEMPEGIGEEYTVDPELEETLAKIARGETTAAEAAAAGAGESGGGILSTIGNVLSGIGGALVDVLPPIPRSILRGGGSGGEA